MDVIAALRFLPPDTSLVGEVDRVRDIIHHHVCKYIVRPSANWRYQYDAASVLHNADDDRSRREAEVHRNGRVRSRRITV